MNGLGEPMADRLNVQPRVRLYGRLWARASVRLQTQVEIRLWARLRGLP